MLAIVIPYYKLTFFETTLESLEKQTDKRFKVYIGNDASPENPEELLEKYKGKFDFVYHYFESISLTQQWERCISLTQDEEWLMILGDDDYLDEKVVESWYKNYCEFNGKSNVIRFASKIVNMYSNNISSLFLHPVWENAYDSYYRKFKGLTRSSLSEYIFSRKSYLKYGFENFPLAWGSDSYAWIEFPEDKMIYTINESFLYIGFSNYSISGSYNNVLLKDEARAIFLKKIITEKFHFFNKNERLELLLAYETTIKKNRDLINDEWKLLFRFYFRNFTIITSIKLIRRFLIDKW